MAMLNKHDHGRSRVTSSTHEISELCSFWLEWLVNVDENLNLRLGGATRGKWRILDGMVESGLMLDSELRRW
jgi:hypothetical protein